MFMDGTDETTKETTKETVGDNEKVDDIKNCICIQNNYHYSANSNEKVENMDDDKNNFCFCPEFTMGSFWWNYAILTFFNIIISVCIYVCVNNFVKGNNFWVIINLGFGLLVLNIFTFGISYYVHERQFKINQEYKLKFRKIYHRERMELVRSNKK